ncbi:unnamed protein product [Heligmosomoides polygyrus]|uniref:Uncharacterized protein n=1 Tax=Heligmosomoides polygyrus TaxID=6339 RepID=A0A183G6G0_HELPZ|nr:unnamed protein product [Heligmosomoides polygyrus]
MKLLIPCRRLEKNIGYQNCGSRCKRFNGIPYHYPEMPDMLSRRVQKSWPFAHIRLDFFDLPLTKDCANLRKKAAYSLVQ